MTRQRGMHRFTLGALIACATVAFAHLATEGAAMDDSDQPNTLSEKERADGWKLLFDGTTTTGWRGFKKDRVPDGWKVKDGALTRVGGGGDIITTEQYDSFELKIDWKISEGGNSGIMFNVVEGGDLEHPYETGPEFQVLDNAKHKDGQNPKTSAGSNYALHAPVKDVTRPVGQWNEARIVVDGNHVEHWMNGVKLVEYELGSPAWKKLVAGSKFNEMPRYGTAPKGHIVLQDHGDLVAYRNIKIRPIGK